MTQEQQRIAIAEACGWKRGSTKGGVIMHGFWLGDEFSFETELPDYLNDLNAMHEAEMSRWIGNFEKLHNDVATYREWKDYQNLLRHNIHAPACCRAEAFVRVIGKWQDTPAPLPPKADDPNHIAGAGF